MMGATSYPRDELRADQAAREGYRLPVGALQAGGYIELRVTGTGTFTELVWAAREREVFLAVLVACQVADLQVRVLEQYLRRWRGRYRAACRRACHRPYNRAGRRLHRAMMEGRVLLSLYEDCTVRSVILQGRTAWEAIRDKVLASQELEHAMRKRTARLDREAAYDRKQRRLDP